MNVCRPPRVRMISPRICARLDCDEAVIPIVVREGAPGAGKIGIERRRMIVMPMEIPASCVGLPDFDESVPQGAATVVRYLAGDHDALAARLGGVLRGEIVFAFGDSVLSVDGTGALGKRVR